MEQENVGRKTRRRLFILAPLFLIGTVSGIFAWLGFNEVIAYTNTTEFCISCHEETIVYEEYKLSAHYKNSSGVRVGCPDCHVPKEFFPKMAAKIKASPRIYHHFAGSIETPEKFEEKRMEMAKVVWDSMEATDSRECRNCHSYDAMDFHQQSRRARSKMKKAMKNEETCIECHQGIAHNLPEGWEDIE